MERSEYSVMAAVEDRHWWYGGMRAIAAALLDEVYCGRQDLRILDAGCGAGAMRGSCGATALSSESILRPRRSTWATNACRACWPAARCSIFPVRMQASTWSRR